MCGIIKFPSVPVEENKYLAFLHIHSNCVTYHSQLLTISVMSMCPRWLSIINYLYIILSFIIFPFMEYCVALANTIILYVNTNFLCYNVVYLFTMNMTNRGCNAILGSDQFHQTRTASSKSHYLNMNIKFFCGNKQYKHMPRFQGVARSILTSSFFRFIKHTRH